MTTIKKEEKYFFAYNRMNRKMLAKEATRLMIENDRLKDLLQQVVVRERSEVHPKFQEEVWELFKKKNDIK